MKRFGDVQEWDDEDVFPLPLPKRALHLKPDTVEAWLALDIRRKSRLNLSDFFGEEKNTHATRCPKAHFVFNGLQWYSGELPDVDLSWTTMPHLDEILIDLGSQTVRETKPGRSCHIFGLRVSISCSICSNHFLSRPLLTKTHLRSLIIEYFPLDSGKPDVSRSTNSLSRYHSYLPTLTQELFCCANDLPTEIIYMVINAIRWGKLEDIIDQVDIVPFDTDVNYTRAHRTPPPTPPYDMVTVLSGHVSLPTLGQETSLSLSLVLSGEFIISGIYKAGPTIDHLIRRNTRYVFPDMAKTQKIQVYINRTEEGIFFGPLCVHSCYQQETIVFDHIYNMADTEGPDPNNYTYY